MPESMSPILMPSPWMFRPPLATVLPERRRVDEIHAAVRQPGLGPQAVDGLDARQRADVRSTLPGFTLTAMPL